MYKLIDSISWKGYSDMTGGCNFIQHPSGILYTVTPARIDNTIGVMSSSDQGETWVEVTSHSLNVNTLQSEAQLVYVSDNDKIYIVTNENTDETLCNLILLVFDVQTQTLEDVLTIITGQRFRPSHTICYDTVESNLVIVGMVIEGVSGDFLNKSGVFSIIIDLDLNILNQTLEKDTTSRAENTTYAGFKLLGVSSGVELYMLKRNKQYLLHPSPSYIIKMYRASYLDPWVEEELYTFSNDFNDDKLTVIANGEKRYLVSSAWVRNVGVVGNQLQAGLSSVLVMGYFDTTWVFNPYSLDLSEPTLSVNEMGEVKIAGLIQGGLRLMSWSPLSQELSSVTFGFFGRTVANIRSTTNVLVAPLTFSFICEEEGKSYFFNNVNLPPIPDFTLTPDISPLSRVTPLTLDATTSIDPDNDNMSYSWGSSSSDVTFSSPSAAVTTMTVLNSWGPEPGSFTVTLSINDLDSNGTIIHSAVTKEVEYFVGEKILPVIFWKANPVIATRGKQLQLQAYVGGEIVTYSWEQISGEICEILSGVDTTTLIIDISNISSDGDTLVFNFTVDDLVNTPVISTLTVVIPPIKQTIYTEELGNIQGSSWSA